MLGYTFLVLAVMVVVLLLDCFLLRTRLIAWNNMRLWKATAVFVVFQLLFDNYFTVKGLWIFNPTEVVGVFVPSIPIENLFFGIELLWLALIFYAYVSRRIK